MAQVNIQKSQVPLNGHIALPAFTAITSVADGAAVAYDKDDQMILVMIKNGASASKNVTIKKGNGLQGVTDLTFAVPAGETHCMTLESGRFKHVTGELKGMVHIIGESTDIQVAAVVLP